MYMQKSIQEFFTKANEVNFDLVALFDYNAVATTNFILFVVVVVASPFLIYRFVKTTHANRFINKVLRSKDVDEYDNDFIQMLEEIKKNNNPLFIKEVYKNIGKLEDKYNQFVKMVQPKDQIIYLQSLSQKIEELATVQDKTPKKIEEYYLNRSSQIIQNDLENILQTFIKNTLFWEEDLEDIYAIAHYAQKMPKDNLLEKLLQERFLKADLTQNYTLVKFITLLEKAKCPNIYESIYLKLVQTFHQSKPIHTIIIDTVLCSQYAYMVYEYIESLQDERYVHSLYKFYFDKKGDTLLNLAFIANDHIDNASHKPYITSITTTSWSNKNILEKIAQNKHLIDIAGHEETRKIMARIDELKFQAKENENKKLALEAKALAQKALDMLQALSS